MCFKMIDKVDLLENPDETQTVKVNGTDGGLDGLLYNATLAANMLIDNRLVAKVIEEVARIGTVQKVTSVSQIKKLRERSVMVTNPACVRELDTMLVHPEVVWVSRHVGLENRALVIQLKDFSYVVRYSLTTVTHTKEVCELELRIKFGIDAEHAVAYHLPANGKSPK